MKLIAKLSLVLLVIRKAEQFEHRPMPTLDPAIPTVAPHEVHEDANSESCAGQCTFRFIDQIRDQLGSTRTMSLLNLNYNDFLRAFSNTTFFEGFCKIYHTFQHCTSKCEPGFLHELLMRSSEIMDHYCVFNFDAIRKKFPCIEAVEPQEACIKTCTSHHNAVTSLISNFKHLALSGDSTQAEKYLAESCEYVTCTLHCDVPAIANKCSFDTANLVIELTRKSFASMEKLALDTNTVSKWPGVCADIKTYRLPSVNDVKPLQVDQSSVIGRGGQAGGGGPDLILLPVESVPRMLQYLVLSIVLPITLAQWGGGGGRGQNNFGGGQFGGGQFGGNQGQFGGGQGQFGGGQGGQFGGGQGQFGGGQGQGQGQFGGSPQNQGGAQNQPLNPQQLEYINNMASNFYDEDVRYPANQIDLIHEIAKIACDTNRDTNERLNGIRPKAIKLAEAAGRGSGNSAWNGVQAQYRQQVADCDTENGYMEAQGVPQIIHAVNDEVRNLRHSPRYYKKKMIIKLVFLTSFIGYVYLQKAAEVSEAERTRLVKQLSELLYQRTKYPMDGGEQMHRINKIACEHWRPKEKRMEMIKPIATAAARKFHLFTEGIDAVRMGGMVDEELWIHIVNQELVKLRDTKRLYSAPKPAAIEAIEQQLNTLNGTEMKKYWDLRARTTSFLNNFHLVNLNTGKR